MKFEIEKRAIPIMGCSKRQRREQNRQIKKDQNAKEKKYLQMYGDIKRGTTK